MPCGRINHNGQMAAASTGQLFHCASCCKISQMTHHAEHAQSFAGIAKRMMPSNITECHRATAAPLLEGTHVFFPWADAPDLKGVRVLVVEDTWHVAKAMKALLERLEMSVLGPNIDHRRGTAFDCGEESKSGMPAVAKEKVVAFLQKPFSGNELTAAMRAACALN
jgi:hypothetical protein